MGLGGLSFGGGFAQGLAGGLMQKRQQDNLLKERQINHLFEGMKFAIDQGADPANLTPFTDALTQLGAFGDPKAQKKGQPGVQDHFTNILGHIYKQGQPQAPSAAPQYQEQPSGDVGPMPEGTPDPLQSSPLSIPHVQPQTPQRQFLGVPIPTHDELADRTVREGVHKTESNFNARLALAQRMIANGTPEEKAMAYAWDRQPRSELGTIPQVGSFGDYLHRTESNVGHQLSPDEVEGARREWTASAQSLGLWAERAAGVLGFDNAEAARAAGQGVQLDAKARELSAAQTGAQATSRTAATGQAKMDVPADVATAQATGTPVGSTSREVVGQLAGSKDDISRKTSLQNVREELSHIQKDLLGALPSKGSLGADIVPGAVISARRRMPAYREQFAKLDSALDNIVNVLARSLAEQRGTQTEKDAERAYNTAVQARDNLLSPTQGDTQETASARIQETLDILDRVISTVPGRPTPVKPVSSHGAPAGGGAVMRDGHLFINGVQID